MPFYDDKKKLKTTVKGGKPSFTPSGASPYGSSMGPAQPQQQAKPKNPSTATTGQRGPSEWVNLQEYYGLNKPQAEGMVEKVAGGIEKKAGAAQGAVTGAQKQFGYGAQQGTNSGPAQHAPGGDARVNYGVTQQQAQEKAQQGYTGPQSLSDINSGLGQQVADAQETVDLANSYEGRSVLMGKEYGGERSAGGNALDNLFLEQAGGERFNDIQDAWGDLSGMYGAAQRQAGEQAAAAQAASEEGRARWGQAASEIGGAEAAAAARAEQDRITNEALAQRQSDEARDTQQRFDETQSQSDAEYAATMGLTLEEWIAAGRPQSDDEWQAYREKQNAK